MKRSARFAVVFLLAGLLLVFLPGGVRAENMSWSHTEGFNERTKQPSSSAFSFQRSGDSFSGGITFSCTGADFVSNFVASVSIRNNDFYPFEKNDVFWRIDSGAEPKSVWQRHDESWGGLRLVGPRALELAFEMLRAKKQVQITTDHGSIVNDLTNYTDAIARMFKHCVTPYVKPF